MSAERRSASGTASDQVFRWELDEPADERLVTFLVYPPDDLVLVVKIQWIGGD